MEKTIVIDGREVRLRASAAIPRLYRIKFRRDILQDMQTIKKAVEKSVQENAQEGGQMSSIPLEALELFENVSYLMAKHADPAVPSTVEEWLDGFETFSIYTVFPAIEELWMANVQQLSTPAKK
ncbi:MAG: hypothetical protein MSK39_10280 [Dysosmobacter sp.]|nr:hypothetical protein [Dysosmobacter sp.]